MALDNGDTIRLTLLSHEAPIAVARFTNLARAGYYDNLTFHRVEPLFVVQGGSPRANEYMGAERFLRDEIGLEHHTTGAVGLSTRGRDTGDGQIFIDLTDQMPGSTTPIPCSPACRTWIQSTESWKAPGSFA